MTIATANETLTMTLIEKLFPKQANNDYQGSVIAQYTFYLLIGIYTFRSFMHFLADDGGINSIASITVFPFAAGAADPNNVIYLFASLWGSAQILVLFIFFICMWRYRNLLPLLWLTVVIEVPMRMIAGTLHPLNASYYEHVPPGSTSNLPLLATACIMLVLSLRHK
jgi:hypothetical protein